MLLGNTSVLARVEVGVAILRAVTNVVTWLLASIANICVWQLVLVVVAPRHKVVDAERSTMAPSVVTFWVVRPAVVSLLTTFLLHVVRSLVMTMCWHILIIVALLAVRTLRH